MKEKLRMNIRLIGMIAAGVVVTVLLFLLLYNGLMPRLSYRRLVFAVTADGAVTSAEAERQGIRIPLSDRQILAVESWLAEYRSENEGISHTRERSGYVLTLHFGNSGRRDEVLYVEPEAIVFDGILGDYRIQVETDDLYSLIAGLEAPQG